MLPELILYRATRKYLQLQSNYYIRCDVFWFVFCFKEKEAGSFFYGEEILFFFSFFSSQFKRPFRLVRRLKKEHFFLSPVRTHTIFSGIAQKMLPKVLLDFFP